MDHHPMVDYSDPRQEEGKDWHFKSDAEGEQQLRRKREILADANGWRYTDTGVLLQKKRIANLEYDCPAEIPTRQEKESGRDNEWFRQAAFGIDQTRRNELPGLEK